jgi:hypothetical protein
MGKFSGDSGEETPFIKLIQRNQVKRRQGVMISRKRKKRRPKVSS